MVRVNLQGRRITIRSMTRNDLNDMVKWRPFADPLYQPFDFPRQNKEDHVRWYEWRRRDPSRRLYTILNEDQQVIGSLTLRDIDRRQSARLGITIGADHVSQGYGTEAVALFLDHFFDKMGFATMVLDVAATNLRAMRCYREIGFREIGSHYRPASHPSYRILLRDQRYRHLRPFFRQSGAVLKVLFYDMVMTREEWHEIVQQRERSQPVP